MNALDRVLHWLGLGFDLELREERIHRITETLWLGPKPRPDEVPALRETGITHVVSCLPPVERAATAFLEDPFERHFIPIRDGMNLDLSQHFPAFFETVDAADRVYVHCQVGVSRSATLAIAEVMRSQDQRFWEAYQQVRKRRHQVLPNIGFASQLQRFELERHPRRAEGFSSLTTYLREACRVPLDSAVLQDALERHNYDAVAALQGIFGGEIPRVVQGVRRG